MDPIAAAVVDSLADALVTFDETGRVVLVNARAEELLGRKREELVGQPAKTLLPERLHAAFDARRAELLANPTDRAGFRLAIVRGDGSEREVEINVTFAEADGRRIATAILTDTLARRRLETRLVEAQKLESIGRLAAGVAHDFNNALTSISGYAHLALSRLPPVDPAHEDIRQIVRSTEHAGRLVTQLQAFSRGERVEVEVIDLNRSVRDVSRLLDVVLGETVEVELQLAYRLPGVEANLGSLEQALMHLALNARDAMPNGGRLVIETGVEELPEGPRVALTLTDTGAGMDERTIRRAYEPFFTTKPGSAGLGLTIVYATVERLGGHIDLDSAPGAGTTVKIYLPPATEPEPHASTAAARLGTVLIVEDEEALRRVVDRILTDEGYTVLTAASGEEALELAAAEDGRIDLLVSDVVLGGMTGPQLATSLRARRPGLKVLLMSGYAGMPVGSVDDFLPKPFSPFELARRIRRLLRP
jgi:two-component system cell cycle sensor histidine kinase/response regulator CckA